MCPVFIYVTPRTELNSSFHAIKYVDTQSGERLTMSPNIIGLKEQGLAEINQEVMRPCSKELYNSLRQVIESCIQEVSDFITTAETSTLAPPLKGNCYIHGNSVSCVAGKLKDDDSKWILERIELNNRSSLSKTMIIVSEQDLIDSSYKSITSSSFEKVKTLLDTAYAKSVSMIPCV